MTEIARGFLGVNPAPGETLVSAGLDSLGAVEFRDATCAKLGVTLPGTLAFDYPTVDALAEHIATIARPAKKKRPRSRSKSKSRSRSRSSEHPLSDPSTATRRVSSMVASLLGETPPETQPLMDAGLDSLAAVELRNMIAAETGVAVPATVTFDHPCVANLAEFVVTLVGGVSRDEGEHERERERVSSPTRYVSTRSTPGYRPGMRVSAVAHRLPGPADALDAITRTPMCRWHMDDDPSDGAAKPPFGAFAIDVDRFDDVVFAIAAPELARMDAQQRELLTITSEALRSSGARRVSDSVGIGARAIPIGVYVGISSMDHQRVSARRGTGVSPFTATGGALSVAAGRVAFAHGLTGATLAVDTACSSSLVAARVAVSARGANEHGGAACVAGVNLLQAPETTTMFRVAGMIALDGRCKSFDAAADGYARGEACVALVLVDHDAASSNPGGDFAVAGVDVLGAFVNQDGRSSSLTAPNGPAQQSAVRGALAAADVAPDRVSDVQTHGTGTQLGDPIEIGALSAAWISRRPFPSRSRRRSQPSDTANPPPGCVRSSASCVHSGARLFPTRCTSRISTRTSSPCRAFASRVSRRFARVGSRRRRRIRRGTRSAPRARSRSRARTRTLCSSRPRRIRTVAGSKVSCGMRSGYASNPRRIPCSPSRRFRRERERGWFASSRVSAPPRVRRTSSIIA